MSPGAPTASEQLAQFAFDAELRTLPATVVEKLKLHLLDTLGVALAAVGRDFALAVLAAAKEIGGTSERQAIVIGSATRLPGPWAALVNGALAHGLDFDDTHQESVVHVSAGILPAALAAAELGSMDGAALLTAFAVGAETSIRIGLAARGGFHDRGYHPTGVCNAFGATLAGGRLLGLTATQLTNALGIVGSQAAGLLEFLTDGTWVKRLHGGWASHAGLVAASLARHDFTGPRAVLDGRFGLYRTHLDDPEAWDIAAVTGSLGHRWHFLDTALKPYPCCHFNHAFIDCAAALRARHHLQASDIERIECAIAAREVPVVCEPLASKRRPQSDYDAKFSLPYAVASMLVRGHVEVEDFAPKAMEDAAVLRLAALTDYEIDPAAGYPQRFGGKLRIRLRGGGVLEHHEPINRGSAERPLTVAEVEDKFLHNATEVLGSARARRVLAGVAALEKLASLSDLTSALRPD